MTEKQWLKSADPRPMLELLAGPASDRQLRLFACACARRVWHLLSDERSRNAVEVAERFADGLATPSQLARACEDACEANRDVRSTPPQREADDVASAVAADAARPAEDFRIVPEHEDDFSAAELDAAYCTVAAIEYAASDNAQDATRARKKEEKALANIMRDLFGNPFRPVAFAPEWRTDTAVAIARQMYESRDFGAMPILADALQDAGCDNDAVLTHCREAAAPHVRGCWVVDLVLGLS